MKSFSHRNVVNFFFVSELDTWSTDLNTNFALGDCLLRAVKLSKNADPDKYGCRGYGIAFDARHNLHCRLTNRVKML